MADALPPSASPGDRETLQMPQNIAMPPRRTVEVDAAMSTNRCCQFIFPVVGQVAELPGQGERVRKLGMCRPYTLGQLGTVSGIPRNWLGRWKYRRTFQNKIFPQQGSAGLVRSPLIGSRSETD